MLDNRIVVGRTIMTGAATKVKCQSANSQTPHISCVHPITMYKCVEYVKMLCNSCFIACISFLHLREMLISFQQKLAEKFYHGAQKKSSDNFGNYEESSHPQHIPKVKWQFGNFFFCGDSMLSLQSRIS